MHDRIVRLTGRSGRKLIAGAVQRADFQPRVADFAEEGLARGCAFQQRV